MAEKTISIYCIGTGHTAAEEFNILRVLYELTNTSSALTVKKASGNWFTSQLVNPPATVPAPAAQHHKVLYDGAPNLPDVGGRAAGHFMNNVMGNAFGLISSVSLNQGDKLTVNLVGHSRGAVNCLMIASKLWREKRPYACNLFLIDAVKVTGRNDPTGATIPKAHTRFIFENVNNCVHIVMEDDVKFKGVTGIFKLYKFGKDKDHPPATDIKTFRFPGTHGTATQCDQIVDTGNPLPPPIAGRNGGIADAHKMWPIGGAVLSMALQRLKEWGTPLHQEGIQLANEREEFNFLNRIQLKNKLVSRFARARLINDAKKSQAGASQEFALVPGSGKKTYRSDRLLNEFGTNLLRYHPIFINQHHVTLAIKFLGEDLVGLILGSIGDDLALDEENRVVKIPGPARTEQLDLHAAVGISDIADEVLGTIQQKVVRYSLFFDLLTKKGFNWQGEPLDQ